MTDKILAVALLLSLPLYSGMTWAADGKPADAKPAGPPPTLVETTAIKFDTVRDEISAVGSLRAEEAVMIRSEIAGRIATIRFAEGQRVEASGELLRLDPAEYQALVSESKATLELNKISFDRTKDLLNKNLASRQAYDEARGKLDESRARLELGQVRLDKTLIRAPFAGVLGLRLVSPGAYVQAGQDLVSLANITSLKLDFRVPELYLSRLQKNQAVEVRLDAFPTQTFQGTVYAVEPTLDEDTRTALVRARVPNPQHELSPGMFARVKLLLEQRERSMLIPEQAIVPKGSESFVYRVKDGKAEMAKVTLGSRRSGEVEILTGLEAADQIVTAGHLKLFPGAAVTLPPPK